MIVRTEKEVQETIGKVNDRLQEKPINKFANSPVKEGYKEVLHILCNRVESIDEIPKHCKTIQGRCIAWLAVDYLHGECDQKTLVDVPLK